MFALGKKLMEIALITLGVVSLILLGSTLYFCLKYIKTHEELSRLGAHASNEAALLNTFKVTAQEALRGSQEHLLQMAKTTLTSESKSHQDELEKKKLEIKNILDPLQSTLERYQVEVKSIEEERRKSYSKVEQELEKVASMGATLSQETSALKNALKKPHVRGRWGEVQLKNCIELAGMSEYSDVTLQDQMVDDDGQRLIPDMTVRMPGGRVVIVDAKTPIDAFMSSLEASDEETRAAELVRHGRHVKEHVKKLATRDYAKSFKDSADFTVMFLPNESFLYAALEAEPDLMDFALQKKVLIATPPTLIGLLKVIRFGWNEERLAENAQKISSVGTELHKRLCDFVDAFSSIGKYLDKAKEEYETGMTRLKSRVLVQAERLEKLGAKSPKNLAIRSEIYSDDTDSDSASPEALEAREVLKEPSEEVEKPSV